MAKRRAKSTVSQRRRRKKVVVAMMALGCIAFNVLLTYMAGNRVDPPSSRVTRLEPPRPALRRQGSRLHGEKDRFTMAPQESSEHTVGMVHIGKTAGSTISQLLRNGCTSFVKGACRNVTHESEVSRQVEHYYHVPDFHRLPTAKHHSFIVSVRDVYERTVSSFLYHHPKNAAIHKVKLTQVHEQYGPAAYACFDTLDEFASLVKGASNPNQCDYPFPHNIVDARDCSALACAALHGKVRFFIHLFFNYRNILYTKLPKDPSRRIFTIRQEFLWKDWENLNHLFGQTEPVYIPPSDINQRNVSGLDLPIGRTMSSHGRDLLCTALWEEYQAYFQLLHLSKNLGPDDIEASLQVSEKQCPNLNLRSMVAKLTRI